MSENAFVQRKKIRKQMAAERILISSLWFVLWFLLGFWFSSYYPAYGYTLIIFGLAAYFTGKQLFFWQCKDALELLSLNLDSWDTGNDIVQFLRLYALDYVKTDYPLDDPYFQIWRAVLSQCKKMISSQNFNCEFSLRLYIELGEYGVSSGYVAQDVWNQMVYRAKQDLNGVEDYRQWLFAQKKAEADASASAGSAADA